jgi:hypothetical protein
MFLNKISTSTSLLMIFLLIKNGETEGHIYFYNSIADLKDRAIDSFSIKSIYLN